MLENLGATELVREALQRLYDPSALAGSTLAHDLLEKGTIRSADGLYPLLLAALERLRPPDSAPVRSHGWRCHRYLQLRYVECLSHEFITRDLGVSLRQASRIHQDALQAVVTSFGEYSPTIPPSGPSRESTSTLIGPSRGNRATEHADPKPPHSPESSLQIELDVARRQLTLGTANIAEVVESACETLNRVAAIQQIQFRVDRFETLPPVLVNRPSLRQILLNVLFYLFQFATVRRGQLEEVPDDVIKIRAELTGDAVQVTVEWGDQLAFVGTRDRGQVVEGSPLRVAMQLAHIHGIDLEEVGDRRPPMAFRLRVPVGESRTVLVVDDNPGIGNLFQRMLAGTRYHPIPVRTAIRALHLAHESQPDVIVLDVVLPGRDGWEVLATLQNDPKTAPIPVVVCSILPDRELALSLGAVGFLAKPVTRDVLLRTLDRVPWVVHSRAQSSVIVHAGPRPGALDPRRDALVEPTK
jgi:CheY-like chemotaxis protein